jgi:hypothetical protein
MKTENLQFFLFLLLYNLCCQLLKVKNVYNLLIKGVHLGVYLTFSLQKQKN